MHELFRLGLEKLPTAEFMEAYFGPLVMEKLRVSPTINFDSWSDDTRDLLKELCIFYATIMPQADHVVRRDVGGHGTFPQGIKGHLLMYFGVQAPRGSMRGHYVGVKYARHISGVDSFNLFIGGSPQLNNRMAYAEEEDSSRYVEGLEVFSKDQLNSNLLLVAKRQNPKIYASKTLGEQGFVPDSCTSMWDFDTRRPDAGRAYFNFWTQLAAVVDEAFKFRLKADLSANNYEKKDLVVSLIEQYINPKIAFEQVLGYPVQDV